MKQLLPSGATAEKGATNPDSLMRDRLWTEVVRRYDLLYQAGVVIWGRRGVEAHLPALQSRVVSTPAAAEGPAAGAEKEEEKKPE